MKTSSSGVARGLLHSWGMKNFTKIAFATLATLIIALPAAASAAAPPAKRQVNQSARIHQGVRSGQLTGQKTRRLVRQQRRINRTKKRMWSDGQLTGRERSKLNRMQNRSSRHIYRAKHNRRR